MLNLTGFNAPPATDTTLLGLLILSFDPFTQGTRAARQPWAKLHNRFAVQPLGSAQKSPRRNIRRRLLSLPNAAKGSWGNYISMPPDIARGLSSSGSSEISASVVNIKPAIEAAFCNAQRVTFAGSIIPAATMSSKVSVSAL